MEHPRVAENWFRDSNHLVFLSVAEEADLWRLAFKAEAFGIAVVYFYEPDLGNALTAIALTPGPAVRKLVSKLPLALSEFKPADSPTPDPAQFSHYSSPNHKQNE